MLTKALSLARSLFTRPPAVAKPATTAPVPAGDTRDYARKTVEKIRTAYLAGRFHLLPWLDVLTDETPEIRSHYRVMLREPTLQAALRGQVHSVAAQEVQVHSDESEDPEDPRQEQIRKAVKYALSKVHGGNPLLPLGRGPRHIAWSILSGAIVDGWSLCEQTYRRAPEKKGPCQGKLIWETLKAKDITHVQLVTDRFWNIEGVRAPRFNPGQVFTGEDLQSFVVFNNLSFFEQPIGLSSFRAAYRAFVLKDTAWKFRGLHLDKYSTPSLKGTYAGFDQKAALEEAFEDWRSSGYITIPAGAMVEALDIAGRGTADYAAAIKDCDQEMLTAVCGAYLHMTTSQVPNARGDSEVQKETTELFQWALSACLGDVVSMQMVAPWCRLNYHDVEPPTVTWGAVSESAMEVRSRVDKALQEIGLKLSVKEAYSYYGRQRPTEPEDILQPKGAGGGAPPPGPGGGPEGPGEDQGGGEQEPWSPFGEWEERKHPRAKGKFARKGSAANAFDAPAFPGKAQTLREFFKAANDATSERPDRPAFHDPARLKVESLLFDLAGEHAETLFFPHGGATLISGPKEHVAVSVGHDGVVLSGVGFEGPDPRSPGVVVFTPDTPPEEAEFYMRTALGLPTSREDRKKYLARDRAERRKAIVEARARKAAGKSAFAEKKDKLGRRLCTDDTTGKRVKCPPLPKEKKERKPAAKKPPAGKTPPAHTVDSVHAALVKAKAEPDKLTALHIATFATMMGSLKVDEIKEINKRLSGVKGSGAKEALIQDVFRRAGVQVGGGEKKPEKVKPPVKPKPAKPPVKVEPEKTPVSDADIRQGKVQPWQAPRDQFVRVSSEGHDFAIPTSTAQHRTEVEEAVLRGKPVPAFVLADYPDVVALEKIPKKTANQTWEATRKADAVLRKRMNQTGELVKVPQMYDLIKEKMPNLTREQFHWLTRKWEREDKLTLGVVNDPHFEPRSKEMIPHHGRGLLGYVQLKPEHELPLPSTTERIEKPSEEAALTARAALEKFTGTLTDSMGRQYHFVDGKRVAGPPEKIQKKSAGPWSDHPAAGPDGKVTATSVVANLQKATGEHLRGGGANYNMKDPWGLKAEVPAGVDAGKVQAALGRAKARMGPTRDATLEDAYQEAAREQPGLTVRQFQETLKALAKEGKVRLYPFTRPMHEATEQSGTTAGAYFFIANSEVIGYVSPMKGAEEEEPPEVKPSQKVEPPAPTRPQPQPPEPGFTGTDSLGRRWENGKLVPGKEEPPKPAKRRYQVDPSKGPLSLPTIKKGELQPLAREDVEAIRDASLYVPKFGLSLDYDKLPKGVASRAALAGWIAKPWLGHHKVTEAGQTATALVIAGLSPADLANLPNPATPLGKEKWSKLAPVAHLLPSAMKDKIADYLGLPKQGIDEADAIKIAIAGAGSTDHIGERIRASADTLAVVDRLAGLHVQTKEGLDKESAAATQEYYRHSAQAQEIMDRMTKERPGSRSWEALRQQYNDLATAASEANTRSYELAKKSYTVVEDNLRTIKEALKPAGPTAKLSAASYGQEVSAEDKAAVLTALSFLDGLVAAGPGMDAIKPVPVITKDPRAGYSPNKHRLNTGNDQDPAIMIHELAHMVETHMPGALSASLAFLDYRTAGEKTTSLQQVFPTQSYDAHEVGRKDDFERAFGKSAWYVGKDYGDMGSEILSMGLEALVRDPKGFARKDPEYCAFVVGILNGSLRDR